MFGTCEDCGVDNLAFYLDEEDLQMLWFVGNVSTWKRLSQKKARKFFFETIGYEN
jgi:hypothetical protein